MKKVDFRIKRLSYNFVQIDIPIIENSDWEWWMMFSSDHHIDSPYCDRALLKKHLDQAKERNAAIHFNGDVMDLMQGVGDKRASKAELLAKYLEDNENDTRSYLDRIIDDAAEFYSPYAKNICTISEGNHEDTASKQAGTNITLGLTSCLNRENKSSIVACPYEGYIKLAFYRGNTKTGSKRYIDSVLIHYHHGYGGGTGKISQRAAMYPQANICISGHSHEFEVGKGWGQEQVTKTGKTYIKEQTHVILATYKNEKKTGRGHAVKGFHRHKVLGAVWGRFTFDRTTKLVQWQTTQVR